MDGNVQQQIDKETNKYRDLYSNNRIELKVNQQSTPYRSPPKRIRKKIEENLILDDIESNNIKYGKTKQGRPVSANNIRRDNSPINGSKEVKNNEIKMSKNKSKNETNLVNKNDTDTPGNLNYSYISKNYEKKDKQKILNAVNNKTRKNETFNKNDMTPEKQTKENKNNEINTKK